MSNILDYVDWRGDLDFSFSDVNTIDILLMSQLAMIDFDKIIPKYKEDRFTLFKEAEKKYYESESNKKEELGLIIPNGILTLFKKMAASKRYKDMKLSNYINLISINKEEQISALTIRLKKNLYCISFSGTDDTIIGWKENINMLYDDLVPAQKSALEYVNYVTKRYRGNFIICGHSKGGNLSIYSGTHANNVAQRKITKIYSFDGPGVNEKIYNSDKYISHIDKVLTIAPQSSIVGRLFLHKEKTDIVLSNEKSFYQHDALSWQVLGTDFIYQEKFTPESDALEEKIKKIISGMSYEERVNFSSACYKLFTMSSAECLLDLSGKTTSLVTSYFKLSKDERKYLSVPIKQLIKERAFQGAFLDGIKSFRNQNKQE